MDGQNRTGDLPFVPPQASDAAGRVDLLLLGITLVALFFSVGIFCTILYFVARYRRGRKVDRRARPINHLPIELTWTVLPLGIAIGLFAWGATVYLHNKRVTPNATPIYVVGKQWMWKVQHPEGRWEINELHVPSGRPLVLILTSEDVIHSFFVPAFRLKQDVIPGLYTRLPFTPTRLGTYHLLCAEFCGTFHSTMRGTVTVMSPAEYEQWLREGNRAPTVAAQGEALFRKFGCSGCHMGGSVRAPRLEGIYGSVVAIQIPRRGTPLARIPATTVIADEKYLHDSIVLPDAAIAAGYQPIMPSFRNRITEAEIFQIIAYLRSLSTKREVGPGPEQRPGPLSPEEYRARTGFVPPNVPAKASPQGMGTATGGASAPAENRSPREVPR